MTFMIMLFTTVVLVSGAAVTQALSSSLTKWSPLAQVITKCTVPNTAALTFDDGPLYYIRVRALFHFCVH